MYHLTKAPHSLVGKGVLAIVPHLTDDKTEAQRGEMAYSGSPRKWQTWGLIQLSWTPEPQSEQLGYPLAWFFSKYDAQLRSNHMSPLAQALPVQACAPGIIHRAPFLLESGLLRAMHHLIILFTDRVH